MFLRLRAYHRPQSLAEALDLRQQCNTRFIGGGTALAGTVDAVTEALVDLSLLNLRYIRQADEAVALGATTALADLVSSSTIKAIGGGIIGAAAAQSGSLAWRARATLGGILATAGVGEEFLAVLLALDAVVLTARPGTAGTGLVHESWDLATFISRRAEILESALIIEVQVPASPVITALQRAVRTPRDLPVVAVVTACKVYGGRVSDLRLSATGLANAPERLQAAECVCCGTDLPEAVVEQAVALAQERISPPNDIRGQADYRRHLAGVLLRRALRQIKEAAAGTVKE